MIYMSGGCSTHASLRAVLHHIFPKHLHDTLGAHPQYPYQAAGLHRAASFTCSTTVSISTLTQSMGGITIGYHEYYSAVKRLKVRFASMFWKALLTETVISSHNERRFATSQFLSSSSEEFRILLRFPSSTSSSSCRNSAISQPQALATFPASVATRAASA
jgi:hypothetical protein